MALAFIEQGLTEHLIRPKKLNETVQGSFNHKEAANIFSKKESFLRSITALSELNKHFFLFALFLKRFILLGAGGSCL